jgi:hypothetical protein
MARIWKKLLTAVGLGLALCGSALAQTNPPVSRQTLLQSTIPGAFPDNNLQLITPLVMRNFMTQFVNSLMTGAIYQDLTYTIGQIAVGTPTGGLLGTGKVNASGGYYVNGAQLTARPANATLYVASTGVDSNSCLSSLTPCLTLQHAVDLALLQDSLGADITINVAAGTYDGAQISKPLTGGGWLNIVGAGPSLTTLTSTNCLARTIVLYAIGTRFRIGSLKVTITCGGGTDVFLDSTQMSLVDNLVTLDAAPFAHLDAFNSSTFNPNPYLITLAGNGTYMFLASTHSTIITSSNVANVIQGTPAVTAFVDAEDHGFYLEGATSSWTNGSSLTGAKYSMALNSTIDTEQMTTPLPGSLPGVLQSGSYYYTNDGIACVGGNLGCRDATTPTGIGSGSVAVQNHSSDHSGGASIVAGAGAAATGTFTIALASLMRGDTSKFGFCVVGQSNNGSNWDANATVQAYYDQTGGDVIRVVWHNNGVNLTNGNSYGFSYVCE